MAFSRHSHPVILAASVDILSSWKMEYKFHLRIKRLQDEILETTWGRKMPNRMMKVPAAKTPIKPGK
jgi:hypothetical protein